MLTCVQIGVLFCQVSDLKRTWARLFNSSFTTLVVNEYTWAVWVRALVYFLGLMYLFIGIAIIADIFMCSIEKITSKTQIIRFPDPNDPNKTIDKEIKLWNDTVANLTLMALGSSSPEILLSVIEVCGQGFLAGDLGPGTIVGK